MVIEISGDFIVNVPLQLVSFADQTEVGIYEIYRLDFINHWIFLFIPGGGDSTAIEYARKRALGDPKPLALRKFNEATAMWDGLAIWIYEGEAGE